MQSGELKMIYMTEVEFLLPKLDVKKIMTRDFHVDNAQRIHRNNNMLEMTFYPNK